MGERKARQAAQKEVDPLAIDPQAAELGAGDGLRSKTISEEEVELRWSTGNEDGNAGFIVQRRKGGLAGRADVHPCCGWRDRRARAWARCCGHWRRSNPDHLGWPQRRLLLDGDSDWH